jgi:hypothetical protein
MWPADQANPKKANVIMSGKNKKIILRIILNINNQPPDPDSSLSMAIDSDNSSGLSSQPAGKVTGRAWLVRPRGAAPIAVGYG